MSFVSIVVALLVTTVTAPVHGQVSDIASDLDSAGRNFSCTGEVVTYTCSAQGTTLLVNSPPLFNQQIFIGSDSVPGAQLVSTAPNAVLTLTNGRPNYTAILQITVLDDTQQTRINVSCSTSNPGPLNNFVVPLIHESQIEPPSNVIVDPTVNCPVFALSRSVSISWTPPVNPQFDIDYYLVMVYVMGDRLLTTRTSPNNSLDVEVPFQNITARVSSVSTCGTISAAEQSPGETFFEDCSGFYAGILVPTIIALLLILVCTLLAIFLVRARITISKQQVQDDEKISKQQVQDDEKGIVLEPHRQSSQ